jgi:hypothetical protein
MASLFPQPTSAGGCSHGPSPRAGESREGLPKLTGKESPFTLERLKCGCESFPCFCYFLKSPFGWEVVQLVGLQTLDLAILVRVQASQPTL